MLELEPELLKSNQQYTGGNYYTKKPRSPRSVGPCLGGSAVWNSLSLLMRDRRQLGLKKDMNIVGVYLQIFVVDPAHRYE